MRKCHSEPVCFKLVLLEAKKSGVLMPLGHITRGDMSETGRMKAINVEDDAMDVSMLALHKVHHCF